MQQYIKQIIDEYIAEKKKQEERDYSKFRVSDAGRCRLMRFLKRLGVSPTDLPDSRTLRIFEVGHTFHKWIQGILQEKNLLLSAEHRLEDEHRLGHIDAVILSETQKLIIYDFKTVHSKKFSYIQQADEHHAQQVLTYYLMLPDEIRGEVEDVRVAYISKDDLRIEEFSVLSPELIAKTKEDWEILISAWEKGKEPEPNPKIWECKFCPYKSMCQGGET